MKTCAEHGYCGQEACPCCALRECRAQLARADQEHCAFLIRLQQAESQRDTYKAQAHAGREHAYRSESERDSWKRAAESQNKHWAAKCEELTECRAELETQTKSAGYWQRKCEQAESERDTKAKALDAAVLELVETRRERDTARARAEELERLCYSEGHGQHACDLETLAALQANVARAVAALETTRAFLPRHLVHKGVLAALEALR